MPCDLSKLVTFVTEHSSAGWNQTSKKRRPRFELNGTTLSVESYRRYKYIPEASESGG